MRDLFKHPIFKLSILLILASSTICCNGNKGGNGSMKIAVKYNLSNVEPFENSNYSVDYKIVPLELPQHDRIKIYLNNIEVFENYIVVSTLRGPIYIFDREGRYISKIYEGKELGDVQHLSDFMIDRNKKVIEVLDNKRVALFTLEGNFISSDDLGSLVGVEYGVVGERRVLLKHKHSLSDYSFTILPKGADFEWKTGQTTVGTLNPKHFHQYQNRLYFTGYSNKVYSMGESDSLPTILATVVNMNRDSNLRGLDRERHETLSAQKKHFTYINNFFIYNPNLWGFSLFTGDTGHKILYDLESNRYYSHPLTGVPYSQNNRWVEEGVEYYLFPPSKFSDDTAETILESSPSLYKAMEEERNREAKSATKSKMWIIKASYTKKSNFKEL
ncbi:MAG: 6-bladed beta-propeller [Bacteroidales bacterium]